MLTLSSYAGGMIRIHSGHAPLLILQIGGVALGLASLAFAPPASGRMLLVPLTADAAHRLIPAAVAHGALLIGPGPLPASYIVIGERARIVAQGVVPIAAPAAGCGTATRSTVGAAGRIGETA